MLLEQRTNVPMMQVLDNAGVSQPSLDLTAPSVKLVIGVLERTMNLDVEVRMI